MNTFKTGKTYITRSACDHECIIEVPIIRRTSKTIRTIVHGEEVTRRIFIDYHGNEAVNPWGTYSMSPVVSAIHNRAGE